MGQPEEPARPAKLRWWELCERLGLEVQRVCPVCGTPLVAHGAFPGGRFSRQDRLSPPPLPPPDESPEPVAQPPPRRVA